MTLDNYIPENTYDMYRNDVKQQSRPNRADGESTICHCGDHTSLNYVYELEYHLIDLLDENVNLDDDRLLDPEFIVYTDQEIEAEKVKELLDKFPQNGQTFSQR